MSRKYGPLLQNGFVVRDWRRAAEYWADVMGVGPFFVMEHIAFERCEYRGRPSAIDMSVAIAYTGEQQIELVQQHNDAPSIYLDFLARSGEGLQHMGVLVPDLDAALAAHGFVGNRVLQRGVTSIGQRFAYVDTELHPGTVLELIEINSQIEGAFAHMRKAAREWDGQRPIRGGRST